MQQHPFTWQQCFRLKFKTLDKRLWSFYQSQHQLICCLKLVMVLQIRCKLGTEKHALPGKKVIREIYLKHVPTEELGLYIGEFKEYFTEIEWQRLMKRYMSTFLLYTMVKQIGQRLVACYQHYLFFSG